MSIHQRIKEGRLRLKLSEEAFARLIGVTRSTVQHWEREGGTAPKRERQRLVAAALNMTVAELVTGASPVAIDEAQIVQVKHAKPDLLQALNQLADILAAVDDLTLDQVRPLIERMAREPKRGREIAAKVFEVLDRALPNENQEALAA